MNDVDKEENKPKKKGKCKYCKRLGHHISECKKLKEKETKKKECCMASFDGNASRVDSMSYVQDSNWAFSACCSHDPSCEDACQLLPKWNDVCEFHLPTNIPLSCQL